MQVLYDFTSGAGGRVFDRSGLVPALDLTILDPGSVTWLPGGGLSVDEATALVTSAPATRLRDALQASEALTLEMWVRPNGLAQSGPARIVALSQNGEPDGGNFILAQNDSQGNTYLARLRTTATLVE